MEIEYLQIKQFASIIGKKEEYIVKGLANVPEDKKKFMLKEDQSEGLLIKYCYNSINTIAQYSQTYQYYNIVSRVENSYKWDRSGEKSQFWIGPVTLTLHLSDIFYSQFSEQLLRDNWHGVHSKVNGYFRLYRDYTNSEKLIDDLQIVVNKLYTVSEHYLTISSGNYVISEIVFDHYFINRYFLHKHYMTKYGFKPDSI